jgi:F0F1-type ATP synthase assembly protein I
METQTSTNQANQFSAINGLLAGGIVLVLSIVFYLINPLLQYTNTGISFLLPVIIIVLLVVLGLDIRKKTGGFWSFGEALKSLVIMSFIIAAMATLYNFVIFKFVNPELPAKIAVAVSESMTERLSNAGLDQAKIDEFTKTFENGEFEAKLKPTLVNELIAFGGSFVFYVIVALIVAAIIKKKAPLYNFPEEEEPSAI